MRVATAVLASAVLAWFGLASAVLARARLAWARFAWARLAWSGLASAVLATAAVGQDAPRPRAVIELFTSQGCSSCTVADQILARLARDPSLLALTLPVDYWDYLGWKDTLGSPAHSARQRAYAMAHGDTKVFTPQVVISGVVGASAKDEASIRDAIDESAAFPEVMKLDVRIDRDGDRVDVNTRSGGGEVVPGEVWLLATAKRREVEVHGGENGGKTLPYVNVVRKMMRLGPWTGRPCRFAIPTAEAMGPDADDLVVLVQAGSGGKPGAILGAAELRR